jgi:hypothetical protein
VIGRFAASSVTEVRVVAWISGPVTPRAADE